MSLLVRKAQFGASKEAKEHEHASTQINVPPSAAQEIIRIGRELIPDEYLAGDGRVEKLHITIKYGVQANEQALRQAIAGRGSFPIRLGKTQVFTASENNAGGVPIIVEVHAHELASLHKLVMDTIGNAPDTYAYTPHITIAYVKSVEAQHFAGSDVFSGVSFSARAVTLSMADDNHQMNIPLEKALGVTAAQKWYHGTSEQNGKQILKDGWIRPDMPGFYSKGLRPVKGMVYISRRYQDARDYARKVGDGYVIEVQVDDWSKMQPDEDDIERRLYQASRGKPNILRYTSEVYQAALQWAKGKPLVRFNDPSYHRQTKAITKFITQQHPDLARQIIAHTGIAANQGALKVVGGGPIPDLEEYEDELDEREEWDARNEQDEESVEQVTAAAAPAVAPQIEKPQAEIPGQVERDEPATDTGEEFTPETFNKWVEDNPLPPEQIKQILKENEEYRKKHPVPKPKPEHSTYPLPEQTDQPRERVDEQRPVVKSKPFKKWFAKSKVVDDSGKPLVVYHGTTHDVKSFNPNLGNAENYYGKGMYFTDSKVDVAANYATDVGPDITSRISNIAEHIFNDMQEQWDGEHPGEDFPDYGSDEYNVIMEEAKAQAKGQIAGGHGGATMPVYLSMQNPVIVQKRGGTAFEYQMDDDGNETGSGVDLWKAVTNLAGDYNIDGQELWNDISENLGPEFDAYDFEQQVRKNSEITNDMGDQAQGDFLKEVYQYLNFDGIIMSAFEQFGTKKNGPGMKMDYDTKHYIPFSPSQVKSALGNKTFDPKETNITAADEDGMLTPLEQAVLAAIDNETEGMSRRDRDQLFKHHRNAWINAASYADQAGVSVEEFRATLTKLTGYAGKTHKRGDYEEENGFTEEPQAWEQMFTLQAGTVLYHGTSNEWQESDELQFPAWFTTHRKVANWFAHRNGDGTPVIRVYQVTKPIELVELMDKEDMTQFFELHGIEDNGMEVIAEGTINAGFNGWIIPNNYRPGDDIMLGNGEGISLIKIEPAGEKTASLEPKLAVGEKSVGDLGLAKKIMQELMPILGVDLPEPELKIVNQPRANWLGRNTWRVGIANGDFHWGKNTQIDLQKGILNDDKTLRRILAHELCHHAEALTSQTEDIKRYVGTGLQGYKAFMSGMRAAGGHGKEFKMWAAKYNAKYGADFVTEKSDETYVNEELELHPYNILLHRDADGKLAYEVSSRMSPKQKRYLDRLASDKTEEEHRLTQTTDRIFMDGHLIGSWYWVHPKEPEIQQKLEELWGKGQKVLPSGAAKEQDELLKLMRERMTGPGWQKNPKKTSAVPQPDVIASKHAGQTVSGEIVAQHILDTSVRTDIKEAYQLMRLDPAQATHAKYELKDIPLHLLAPGDDYSPAVAQQYADSRTPFPPIVMDSYPGSSVFSGTILDGNHRVAAAKMRGDKTIQAYVPVKGSSIDRDNDDIDDLYNALKTSAVPQLDKLEHGVSKEYDRVRWVYQHFYDNRISTMSWKDFQKKFQWATNSPLFTQVRQNRPNITLEDLERWMEEYRSKAKEYQNYELEHGTYQDKDTSFRDVEQLVLKINQSASAAEIIGEDEMMKFFLTQVAQGSVQSGHPVSPTTVGWLRVDFINEQWLLIDEVQSDLINGVDLAKRFITEPTLETLMQGYKSETVKQKIRDMGATEQMFQHSKQEFARRGYTTEKLDEMRAGLVNLFADWAEYGIASLIEIARRNGIQNIAIHTGQSIAKRDPDLEADKAVRYYDQIAKAFGFKKQPLDIGDLKGEFWVRTAKLKPNLWIRTTPKVAAVKILTREQAIALERKANQSGKHKGVEGWEASYGHMPEGNYVLTTLPLTSLNYVDQDPDRQEFYAGVPGDLPPVLAHYSTWAAKRRGTQAAVMNGNHRCMAAEMRGDSHIAVLMPEADYKRFQSITKTAGRAAALTSLTLGSEVKGFPSLVLVRWEDGMRWRQVLKSLKAIVGDIAGKRVAWRSIFLWESLWENREEQDAGWEEQKSKGKIMFDILHNGSYVSVGAPYKPEEPTQMVGYTGTATTAATKTADTTTFTQEFNAGTQPGDEPNQRERDDIIFDLAYVIPDPDNRTVSLQLIQSRDPGEGKGSKGLDWLCALADKHGVIIILTADPPHGTEGIGQDQLVRWYKRHGFWRVRGGESNELIRHPMPKKASHKTPALSDTQYGNPEQGEETNAYANIPERVEGKYDVPNLDTLLGKSAARRVLLTYLQNLTPDFAAAAQKCYDAWQQDENGMDEENGSGGVCDEISETIMGIIAQEIPIDVHTTEGGQAGDDHSYVIAYMDNEFGKEVYSIDIPPGVYETGGGYNWKKIPDVTIRASDVQIGSLDIDPSEFAREGSKTSAVEGVRYTLDIHDSHRGELFGKVEAILGEDVVGYVQFSELDADIDVSDTRYWTEEQDEYGGRQWARAEDYPREVHIKYVYVNPQYRRQGVGTGMYEKIKQEFPGEKIVSSGTTDEGGKFRNKLLERGVLAKLGVKVAGPQGAGMVQHTKHNAAKQSPEQAVRKYFGVENAYENMQTPRFIWQDGKVTVGEYHEIIACKAYGIDPKKLGISQTSRFLQDTHAVRISEDGASSTFFASWAVEIKHEPTPAQLRAIATICKGATMAWDLGDPRSLSGSGTLAEFRRAVDQVWGDKPPAPVKQKPKKGVSAKEAAGKGQILWEGEQARTAGTLSKAVLPAVALLGLGGLPSAGTTTTPQIKSRPPAIVETQQSRAMDNLITAISRAEGAKPERNNPGNIVDFSTGKIREFETREEGIAELKAQLERIANGDNPNFDPNMSLRDAGLVYSGGDPNWAKNVAQIMHVHQDIPIAHLIRGKRAAKITQADRILAILEEADLYGFGDKCAVAAVAINNILFKGKGKIVTACNTALLSKGYFYGHVAVQFGGRYWDAEGMTKLENIEAWGMLDPEDTDYKELYGEGWNEELAYGTTVQVQGGSVNLLGQDSLLPEYEQRLRTALAGKQAATRRMEG